MGRRLALAVLVPVTLSSIAVLFALLPLALTPLLGVFVLPSISSLLLWLIYSISWTLLVYAAPPGAPVPRPIFHPRKAANLTVFCLRLTKATWDVGAVGLYASYAIRRLLVLGSKDKARFLRQGLVYADEGEAATRKVDIYLPQVAPNEQGSTKLAPVIIFIGGLGWSTLYRRSMGTLVGLRLRQRGYLVAIPDITQYPDGGASEMVQDVRTLLHWLHARAASFGGDPARLYLMGYDTGATISLLTVVQNAISLSPSPSDKAPAAGDAKMQAAVHLVQNTDWGDDDDLPRIKGMILLAGYYDVVKSAKWETKLGIEPISKLRRVVGSKNARMLASCPAHLLYGSRSLLSSEHLPQKTLIIHGGRDTLSGYGQAVLLNGLLAAVGADTDLKLFRGLNHWTTAAALMKRVVPYSVLFLAEIDALISSTTLAGAGVS